MKKRLLKYFMVLLLIGAGALVLLYAQKNHFFSNNKKKAENKIEEQELPENIGTLTDDDPWKEIDKLVTSYYNTKGVLYNGNIKLIDDNGDKEKIIEDHKFQYSTLGNSLYYKLGNMEFVSKPDLILVADHTNKFISVSLQNSTEHKTKKLFDIAEFKKLMENSKAQAKVTQLNDQKILTIENIVDPQIQGYRIYYDPVTYRISKMLIGMLRLSPLTDEEDGIDEIPVEPNNNTDNKTELEGTEDNQIDTYIYYLEITYSKTEILNLNEKTFNPEAKFIKVTANKIELLPAFNKYQLVSSGDIQSETDETIEDQE
jgi:hypothetical protein